MNTQADYDVVIVGAGVAGALIAKRLTEQGAHVLLLEAGPGTTRTAEGYQKHLEQFYTASSKGPESPWPPALGAPQPDTADLKANNGYFIQNGPNLYGSSYTRLLGGSTLHFLGVSLRMLPNDFKMKTEYQVSRDWPLSYDDLEPYYRRAEYEIGVSANVEDQAYLGLTFAEGYNYPMQRVPLSYSDKFLSDAVNGLTVPMGDEHFQVNIRSYPAARNSIPRAGYQPVGMIDGTIAASSESYMGQRCEGNTSCIPVCPVQAKYNAGKSLSRAKQQYLTTRTQAVASKVLIDTVDGLVKGIEYKHYDHPASVTHTSHVAKGRVYVLAAHAVENAKLMLASGITGPGDRIGTTLMDHPTLYAWGLAPKPVGAYRGPQSTAGVEDLRDGNFRTNHAAFRFDVGNDGWRAPTGAPDSAVSSAVLQTRLFGKDLRHHLEQILTRQVRFSLAVEQLPDTANRVSIDARYLDPLGNPRPIIDYRIDDYTLEGMVAADAVAKAIFSKAGVDDWTEKGQSSWFPSVEYKGRTLHYHGMGHFAGTHAMGADKTQSVVDRDQRCWQHANLFMVGSGSMPTMGTSNPTLTLAALALRTADRLLETLHQNR